MLQEPAWPGIFLRDLVFVSRRGPAPAGPARPKGNFTVYEIPKTVIRIGDLAPPPSNYCFLFLDPPSPVKN